jgi:CBS domain-containing protein
VRDVVAGSPVTIPWRATVGVAWQFVRKRRVRHLAELDDADRLVGILTDRGLRQVILDPAIQEQRGTSPRP